MITSATEQRDSPPWNRCARDWAEIQEPRMGPLYQVVLKALSLAPDSRLLDVGCASGVFCEQAGKTGASITGLDLCPAFLVLARQRVPSLHFVQGDMVSLPFEDGSFDVVTGLNVFYYASSPLRALREACRVLKPRGRLVISSWGNTDRCDTRVVIRTLNALMPPSSRNNHSPFSFSNNGALKSLVSKAGFTHLLQSEALVSWTYPNEQTALRAMLATGLAQHAIDQAGQLCVQEVIRNILSPLRLPQGGYRIQNYFNYLLAQKS